MKLILNERKEIGDMIANGSVPDHFSKRYLITLLAGYYRGETASVELLAELVKKQMKHFSFPVTEYQEYQWQPFITAACQKAVNGELRLREASSIPLYRSEFMNISSCGTDRQKKVLFTLYIISRFMNTDGWVNLSWAELFKRANVSVTVDGQIGFIRYLADRGFLTLSLSNDNLNLQVIQGAADETVMEVSSLDSLGNQFIGQFKKGYRQCECCKKVIRMSSNKIKYCKKCGEMIHRAKQRQSMTRLREIQKCDG